MRYVTEIVTEIFSQNFLDFGLSFLSFPFCFSSLRWWPTNVFTQARNYIRSLPKMEKKNLHEFFKGANPLGKKWQHALLILIIRILPLENYHPIQSKSIKDLLTQLLHSIAAQHFLDTWAWNNKMEKVQSTADAAKLTQYSAPEWDYFKFKWDFIRIKFETIQSWYTNTANGNR